MKKFVYRLVATGKDYFINASNKENALNQLKNNGIKPFFINETRFRTTRVPIGQFNFEMSLR